MLKELKRLHRLHRLHITKYKTEITIVWKFHELLSMFAQIIYWELDNCFSPHPI